MSNVPHRQEVSIHDTLPPGGGVPQLPTFFLRTKLLPPRPAPSLLRRPRLTERLVQNLAHAVTLVTAPQAQARQRSSPISYAQASAPSSGINSIRRTQILCVFLGYVTHGIRQLVPGFGDATFSYMREAAKELAQQPERAVDVLLNEVLDSVEQQFILVLDDYHHLGAETSVHRVVDRLLAYLPDVMHVIIISRDMPPLALARMRTQASLAVVDRQELFFTDEETRELFRQGLRPRIDAGATRRVSRAHAWVDNGSATRPSGRAASGACA